jgi:molybdenum cofactor cytidylyltransferase
MDIPTFKYVFRPDNEPRSWGLRGDPELWRYLAALLYHVPLPRDPEVALQLIKDSITNFTGWDCESTEAEVVPVKLSLLQDGSGMSTGAASVAWWIGDGFPLIHRLISEELREYQELSLRNRRSPSAG